MKKTIRCLSIVVTVTLLALPVFANRVNARAGDTVQEPCSTDGKIALYSEFYKELKGDQAKAFEAAKKYVACPLVPAADPPTPESKAAEAAEAARINYLKGFISKYEKQDRFTQLTRLIDNKKYAEAFPIGKDILNEQPDNLQIILDLTNAGYAANSAALDGDTVAYAKKSIQLIGSGKVPEKWGGFESKDGALGWMNYIIATRIAKNSLTDSIPYLIKAASYEGYIKKLPLTYNSLGDAYEKGPFAKQSAAYKAIYENKEETPESKLAIENINQIVDRMIDAYARAVALSGSDPQYKDVKALAMAGASDWYKFRHDKSEAGLNEMIVGVLSKPLPPEPTPITSLPTPPATPAPGPGTSATGSGAAPLSSNGTSTGTPAKTTTASSPTKAPGPTKPKRAHAQR